MILREYIWNQDNFGRVFHQELQSSCVADVFYRCQIFQKTNV